MMPSCSSDSRSRSRSKTATCVAGRRDVDPGLPLPETRITVPVSASAQSTPVTPTSASAASSRWRARASAAGSESGAMVTWSPSAPRLGRRSSPSASGAHERMRRASRSRAICRTSPGTASRLGARWNTPATRSNSSRKRSSASGQRSAIWRRTASAAPRGSAGRGDVAASKRPRVLPISSLMAARKSARVVTIGRAPSSAR